MDNFGQAALITVALLMLSLVVTLGVLVVRAVALHHSIGLVAAGKLRRDDAITAARKLTRRMLSIVALAACLGPLLTLTVPWASGSPIVDPHLWFGVFGVVYSFTFFCYGVAGSTFIGARQMRSLRGLAPSTAQIISMTLRAGVVNSLPIAIITVGLATAFAGGWTLDIWLLCLVAVTWKAIVLLFGGHAYRFVNPTQLADESTAPGLRERVAYWASRCGVSLPDVRILRTATLGSAIVGEVGPLDRTLLISDNALATRDWRQQDATIVYALQTGQAISGNAILSICIEAFTYGLIGFLFTAPSSNPATSSVFAILVLSCAPALTRPYARHASGPARHPDLVAAELTGDPLAVMVGINTLTTLNEAKDNLTGAGMPIATLEDRMRALDAWMQQPGPRAPWAYQPVPSRWPVTIGSYLLTAPLESAPPPAPVPTASYPTLAAAPATP